MSDPFDLLVVGAGPGGYIAALKGAQLGARVGIVEKHELGGTCLNYGCIPSKALLASAEILHTVRESGRWGVEVSGQVGFDWKKITDHKTRTIGQLRGGIASLLKGRSVTHLQGLATLDAPGRVVVQGKSDKREVVTAKHIVLATGSSPIRIPGWPDDPDYVCTSDEAVHWTSLPSRLLIVGGGVIGCEFACMMQSFGVQVTIVEMLPHLLATLDNELGTELHKIFKARGISCHLDTKVEDMQLTKSGVRVRLSSAESLEFDRVLVATGRKPNTHHVALDQAGISADGRGFVSVNEQLETNVPNHYCIGDANGMSMLAHAASSQGVAVAENALGKKAPWQAKIPAAVYTFPEVAAVGMSQQEATAAGLPIAIGRFPLAHLGKAMATRQTDGFVKMIRHRETGQLLGAHMIGHNATECIAAATGLLQQQVSMQDIAETVWAHPTISEAIKEAAEDSLGLGLHLPPRKVIPVVAEVA
ncbi:MAG: dihydrolipoyl dehydrogenase [Planctomycetaceae bacterium]|nr:dihydrolipoyl dehydrogenase [Planctomycetaceae bacterium]